MFVIFKNEEGTFSVRPAFIGFIKNDTTRRVLCTLVWPFTLVITIVFSLLQATVIIPFLVLRSVYYPIVKSKPIWKTEIWQMPRTKADNKK